MVMQILDLRYTELPRTTWRQILSETHLDSSAHASTPRDHIPVVDQLERSAGIGIREDSASKTTLVAKHTRETHEDTSATKAFNLIVESISKSTGSDPSEFTDDVKVADFGVDSIMAIEIVAAVKTATGLELPPSFLFDYPTIGDLRRAFGGNSVSQDLFKSESSSNSSAADTTASMGLTPRSLSKPVSDSSLASSVVMVEEEARSTKSKENKKAKEVQFNDQDTSPLPAVRITLLKGRLGPERTLFYIMSDGTGSIATYIHLPPFKSQMPVYGIDSPFLCCPSRLTPEVGIKGVAKLIADTLVQA